LPRSAKRGLDPRSTWSDKCAYDDTGRELTYRFEENFREFEPLVGDEIKEAPVPSRAG
jgi:phosphoenolpyruvate carboxykinase (ATP)